MKSDSRPASPFLWVPLALVLLALGLRWMKLESPGMNLLPNFAPVMALVFTGTLVFPRGSMPWWVWPLMLIGMDFAVMGSQLWERSNGLVEILSTYFLYGCIGFLAGRLRGRVGIWQTLAGVAGCGLAFYFITNCISWLGEPNYSKDLAGFIQAQVTGLPGYAPTWTFLRNSMLSDLGFSALLLIAFNAEARVRSAPPIRWAAA